MQIGQLAQETGLTSHTLRYYEKEGLLPRRYVQRGQNNYRDYAAETIERIAAIKALHSAGFTLSEIKEFLDRWDSGELTQKEALLFLHQKLESIDTQITELKQARNLLVDGIQMHIKQAKKPNR